LSAAAFTLTLDSIRSLVVMFLDIFIMWLIFYYALRLVRSNSRTVQIFKGILLIVLVDGLAKLLCLKTLQFITDMFINWGFLAVIIVFQPEIRSLLEHMGKNNVFSRINTLSGNEKENLVEEIVTAVMLLSKDQTGALISIEQSHTLDDFVETGTILNSDVTAELLTSIFVTSTPLHDGAVIIQGDKIACASAYFPPTSRELPGRYGARHRAAIGISEITDAVTIVVSEETGNVSITENGHIYLVNRTELHDYLMRVICGYVKKEENVDDPVLQEDMTVSNAPVKVHKETEKPQENQKIEAVKVKPAETQETDMEEIHEAADEEAITAAIKLPHKKKRPKPSYPNRRRRYPNRTSRNKGGEH
jgi:diadenylate cyclase